MTKYRIRKLDSKNIVIEKLIGEKKPVWVIDAYFGKPADAVNYLIRLAIPGTPNGAEIDRPALHDFASAMLSAAEKIESAIRENSEFEL